MAGGRQMCVIQRTTDHISETVRHCQGHY